MYSDVIDICRKFGVCKNKLPTDRKRNEEDCAMLSIFEALFVPQLNFLFLKTGKFFPVGSSKTGKLPGNSTRGKKIFVNVYQISLILATFYTKIVENNLQFHSFLRKNGRILRIFVKFY